MGAEPSADPPARCTPIGEALNADESPVYVSSVRLRENGGVPIATFRSCPEVVTTPDLLRTRSVKWPDHDCFGERERLPDGKFGQFKWMSSKEVYDNVCIYAAGLASLGLKKGDRIGLYSHTCRWWSMTEYAAHMIGAVVVPVYDSLGPNAAEYIVNHADCKTIVANVAIIDKALSLPGIDRIIAISDCPIPDHPEILTTTQILEKGRGEKLPECEIQGDDMAFIMYTSGSTGQPKGCVLTHRNLIAGGCGLSQPAASITSTDVYYAFLPLAHIYEVCAEICFVAQGVAIGYYSGDNRNLLDDLAALRPTMMLGVPRVFNRLYDNMTKKIEEQSTILKNLLKWSIKYKSSQLGQNKPTSLLTELLFAKFRGALGGRIRLLVSGGAPILPEVYEFIRAVITPNVIQGYGLTECSAAGCIQEVNSKNPQAVGPISYATDLKLRRVPEMDYNPQAPVPSGEIMLRGPSQFREYYKDPELTKEAVVNGWFATGDVGCILPDGTVQIIDRVKQLVKLSQGEYISMTSLTDIYGTSKNIEFIYIYADSHHNYPVALVVPTEQAIKWWGERKITDIVNSNVCKKELMDSLNAKFEEAHLRGFEKIQDILIDLEPFTIDNQLLTPSLKPQFNVQRKKFSGRLIDLYSSAPGLRG